MKQRKTAWQNSHYHSEDSHKTHQVLDGLPLTKTHSILGSRKTLSTSFSKEVMKSLRGNHKSLSCPELIQWNKCLGTKLSVTIPNTPIFYSHLLFLKDSPIPAHQGSISRLLPPLLRMNFNSLEPSEKNTSWIPQQANEKNLTQVRQWAWAIPPSPALQSPPKTSQLEIAHSLDAKGDERNADHQQV